MKRTVEANKVKRLQSRLHLTDVSDRTRNSHVFFVDNEEELKNFNLAERLQTHPALLGRKSNRMRLKDLEKMELNIDAQTIKRLNEEREKSYKELDKRITREKELSKIQRKMELKTTSKKQRKATKPKELLGVLKSSNPIFKFKYERKK
jgi:U3 small nucleolar RNA-associated protein 11